MNAERLLKVYEQISKAPDAILRLRRFVLDLAVRGKLVDQDAADEPASELVAAINELRENTNKKAKRGKRDIEPVPFNGDLFHLPNGWSWTALATISDVTMGQSPPGSTYNKSGEGVPLINGPVEFTAGPFGRTVVNQFTTAPTNFCKENDFLICVRGSTTGRTNIAAFKACIGRGVAAISPLFDDGFVRMFLWKSRNDIIGMGRGIAFPSISKKQLEGLAVPLPPLAEQYRIVARVDELMALCDQLEDAQKTREETRDKLTAASLTRLTAPETSTEEFPAHAQFALDTLPSLTSRPDQIKTLRQTILNLAVRGKLVEQDPAEGNGSELMATISSNLNLRKSARAESNLIDFATPKGWDLQCLGAIIQDGPKNGVSPTKTENQTAPKAITLTATTSGQFDGRHFKRVDVSLEAAEAFWLQPNDLLFQRGNTPEYVGMAAIYDGPEKEFIYPDLIMRVRIALEMDLRFVHLWCISPVARNYLMANATGAQKTMPKINQGVLKALPIMVPPLAEQHRIVAKVDALMALCDRLEKALTEADTTRTHLLEAHLHEALEPATGALEAAE